jgi:hypothetical protein
MATPDDRLDPVGSSALEGPDALETSIEEADDEAEEGNEKDKSIADRLESTLRGFLDFVLSYSRTLAYAMSLPQVAKYKPSHRGKGETLVRPLTFLCCSYLPCAVILELSGSSLWEVLLSPEIAITRLATKLQEISPTKILLTSIPVLIAVYLGSTLLSRALTNNKKRRDDYRYGMCYAFGLQFAGTALLLFFLLLGHSRIAEQIIPPGVIDIMLWPLLGGRLWFVLAVVIAVYPLAVSVAICRRISHSHRALRMALSLAGSLLIMGFAYWLGVLPARFKDVTQPEPEATAEIYEGEISTETADPQKCFVQILIHNPTNQTMVIEKASGIRVNARINESGIVFPNNAFFADIKYPESQEPILVVGAGGAAWLAGDISPDYRDWQLLKQSQETPNSLYLKVGVVRDDGSTIDSEWEQVSLIGKLPQGI